MWVLKTAEVEITMSKKTTIILVLLLLVVIVLAIVRTGQRESTLPSVKRTQIALGTFVEIEVRNLDQQAADRAINAAFAEVLRIHDEFSPFNEDGPLWRINHSEQLSIPITAVLHHMLLVCV
jgi:thiamine biosynthesis lipoprotein ApbE